MDVVDEIDNLQAYLDDVKRQVAQGHLTGTQARDALKNSPFLKERLSTARSAAVAVSSLLRHRR